MVDKIVITFFVIEAGRFPTKTVLASLSGLSSLFGRYFFFFGKLAGSSSLLREQPCQKVSFGQIKD